MSVYPDWRGSGHLERAIETAGGEQAFEEAVERLSAEARTWRSDVPEGRGGAVRRPRAGATRRP
ncbi:hypothetical protein [Nocardiopsis sp. LOL_012]|uniref:hypothetical protein n=1 Tax=Nocardiopsis sp. LOL_012 TaxID=3345409 RepID=UPI003A8B8B1E